MAERNYLWLTDGTFDGRICETSVPADDVRVFAKFTDARDALANHYSRMESNYAAARYRARKLRLKDVER